MEVEEKGGGKKLFLHCKGWTGHLMFALIKVNKLILTFYSTLNLCSHDRGNFWFRLECLGFSISFSFCFYFESVVCFSLFIYFWF